MKIKDADNTNQKKSDLDQALTSTDLEIRAIAIRACIERSSQKYFEWLN